MKRFILSFGFLLYSMTAATADESLRHIPPADPVWADIEVLVKYGVIHSNLDEMRRRPATKMNIGILTVHLVNSFGLINAPATAQEKASQFSESPLLRQPEVAAALGRLVVKFKPEIERIGIRVDQIRLNGQPVGELSPVAVTPVATPVAAPVATPAAAPSATPAVAPPATPAVTSPTFADVTTDHWAFDAVETLRRNGLMLGFRSGRAVYFNAPTTN